MFKQEEHKKERNQAIAKLGRKLKVRLTVQASIYVHKQTGHRYRVPGAFSHLAAKIYRALDIKRNCDATTYLP